MTSNKRKDLTENIVEVKDDVEMPYKEDEDA